MKTRIIFTLALFFVTITNVNAQFWNKKIKGNGNYITKNRTVKSFNSVKLAGSFDIELIEGNEGSIKINTDENLIPYIITEVKKNTLKIRFKKGYSYRSRRGVKIKVGFNKLTEASLAGSGDIYCKNTIIADHFKTAVAGSGDIELILNAQSIEAKIAGSGDILLEGNTDNFKVAIAGSGDVSAYKLKANKVNVRIAGSGDVETNVVNEIHGKIAGSGDISYKGNPETVKLKSAGSGDITKVK